jgi:hypothetical protein
MSDKIKELSLKIEIKENQIQKLNQKIKDGGEKIKTEESEEISKIKEQIHEMNLGLESKMLTVPEAIKFKEMEIIAGVMKYLNKE